MRFGRSLQLVWCLLALMLVVGMVSAQEDKTLRILSNADIRTSDPHIAYETETWPTSSLFYVGLVRLQDAGTPIPALAESWTVSDDGTTFTFVLREGVKFSNGRDLTPEDVKWSFERLLSPATAAPTAFMFQPLLGAEEFQSGAATEVSGIKILDARTIEFTMSTPVWSMMQRFALPPAFIIAKEGVEAAGDQFGFQPLGAGPFMVEDWQSGVIITGTRNPYYFEAGQPFFDRFEMQLGVEPSVGILRIESGEADIALDFVPTADYPRIVADPVLSTRLLRTAGFPNTDYLIINNNKEPFNNLDVRKAMSMAVDRERLAQILNGRAVPLSGFLPPNVPGDNADLPVDAYDPEAAKQLLADAGYPDGFSTTMLSNTDPISLSEAQAVISDLAAIGIQVELTSLDNAQFLDILTSKPEDLDLVMTAWFMDYQDPSNNWEPLLKCDGSYNWAKYCSEDLDAIFEEANLKPFGDERWAAFAAMEALVAEQVPNVFLVHRIDYYLTSERLQIGSDPAVLLKFAEAGLK